LDTPKNGEYYGSSKSVVSLTGGIIEENLDTFSLRYGSGDDPPVWTALLSGDTIPVDPQLHSWKVGKDDGIPDGVYTLSLFAKDKVALEEEARIRITIDNAPPTVSITAPAEGEYVKSAREIRGQYC
jgi:hypothetical protein